MAVGKQVGKLSIKVIPDTTTFKADLKRMIERVEKTMRVNLKVVADTKEAELELTKFRNVEAKNGIKVDIRASTVLAKSQIAVLTRDRFVQIHARLDKSSWTKAATLIGQLSGFRVAHSVLSDITNSLKSIDLNVPKISRVALAISALTSSVLTSSVGLVTLGGDLLKIGNLGLVLPAMFASLAIGVTTLALALKDAKTQLAVLAPAFHELQDTISGNFWAQAQQPIISFFNSILPQLRQGFGVTATALGKQAAAISDAFKKTFANGVLSSMFDKLAESMDIVTGGSKAFAETITTLGTVGMSYMPRLSKWVVKIGDDFNNWLQGANDSGALQGFIEDGITQLKLLGSSLHSIGSIFSGINKAAENAGAQGLTSFAAKLKGAADIVNGPTFQTALTTILEGASKGMAGLGKGFKAFGSAIAELAPTLKKVLGQSGEALGGLLAHISDALKQPAFKKGLGDFFDGISKGVDALGPAMAPLFEFVGKLGTTVGALAAQIGPLLAVMKETFAPLFDAVLDAVTPLIPLLGGALVDAINTVAPLVQGLADFIGSNKELVQGAVLVFGGLALVIKAVSFVAMIAGWVANTAAMLISKAETIAIMALYAKDFVVATGKVIAGLALSAAAWVKNTAMMLLDKAQTLIIMGLYVKDFVVATGKVVAGLALTAAAWVKNTAKMLLDKAATVAIMGLYAKDMVIAVGKTIASLAISTAGWVANTAAQVASKVAMLAGAAALGVATAAQWAMNVAMDANPIGLIVLAIAALVAGLIWFFTQTKLGKEIWANFTKFLGEAWDNIVKVAQVVFKALGDFFVGIWTYIVDSVVFYVNLVHDTIVNVVTAISDFWNGMWAGFFGFISDTWTNIVNFVTTYINTVWSIITTVGQAISDWWNGMWTAIGTFLSDTWNNIVLGVTTYITTVQTVLTTVGQAISDWWNGMWGAIGTFLSDTWNNIVLGVTTAIGVVSGIIESVGKTISDIWNGIWNGITGVVQTGWDLVTGLVTKIVNSIKDMIGGIGDTVKKIPKVISDVFTGAGQWLADAGRSIVEGLVNGIKGAIGWAKDTAKSLMKSISNFFPHSPAPEGPFSGRGWTLYSGQAMVEGLAEGMSSRVDLVKASALATMNAAKITGSATLADAEFADDPSGTVGAATSRVALTINNPQAEPTSQTLRTASQLIGAALV